MKNLIMLLGATLLLSACNSSDGADPLHVSGIYMANADACTELSNIGLSVYYDSANDFIDIFNGSSCSPGLTGIRLNAADVPDQWAYGQLDYEPTLNSLGRAALIYTVVP